VDDGASLDGALCDSDGMACTIETCFEGECGLLDANPCDDNNWCTSPDICLDIDPATFTFDCENTVTENGTNAAEYGYIDMDPCEDVLCYDGNETPTSTTCDPPADLNLTCNEYRCDPFGEEDNCTAFPVNEGAECNDDNGCTLGEVCEAGMCGSDATPRKICDDENICTEDYCDDTPLGNCVFDGTLLNGSPCSDGDLCTGAEESIPFNDVCEAGVCAPGSDRDCSDAAYNDQCHAGVCNADTGGCERQVLKGRECDDGDLCTEYDICGSDGACTGTEKVCSGDQCNNGSCDASSGACVLLPKDDGTACAATDGTGLCTPNDVCVGGVCEPDTAHQVVCTGDTCNTVYCDPDDGTCKYDNAANLNKSCDGVLDDDSCTLDQCVGEGAGAALACTQVADNDISAWYAGDIVGTLTIDGIPANADTLTDSVLGNAQGYLLSGTTGAGGSEYAGTGSDGWAAGDHVWEIEYTGGSPVTVTFSGCLYGGEGAFDGQAALLDCAENVYGEDDDACTGNEMAEFQATLSPGQTYFLMVDGFGLGDSGAYQVAIFYDTCSDGVLNGAEIAVDSGGADCCANGVRNGDEEDVDRGGSCCADGVLDGDETEVDCGGDYCDACNDLCENGLLDPGELDTDCGGTCPIICTTSADCDEGEVCITDVSVCGMCVTTYCNGMSDKHLALGHQDSIVIPMQEGCADVVVDDQFELNHIHSHDRNLKFQMMGQAGGSCKYRKPNYTYFYSTKYCVTYQGTANKTYDEFMACPEWGYTSGTGRVTKDYYRLKIPVEQYTLSARLSFIDNGDDCVLNANIYWQ
jgi:hypothetical protein